MDIDICKYIGTYLQLLLSFFEKDYARHCYWLLQYDRPRGIAQCPYGLRLNATLRPATRSSTEQPKTEKNNEIADDISAPFFLSRILIAFNYLIRTWEHWIDRLPSLLLVRFGTLIRYSPLFLARHETRLPEGQIELPERSSPDRFVEFVVLLLQVERRGFVEYSEPELLLSPRLVVENSHEQRLEVLTREKNRRGARSAMSATSEI